MREGGEGDDPGGIVDEGDEVGLSALAPVADLGSVHDIAHPQLAGVAEGESSPVGGDGVAGVFVEQALAREQAVHGGGGEGVIDAALACDANQGIDRECGLLGLERDEQLGDLGGQAPGLAAVGAGLRIQRLEPAGAIETEPVAHGLHGDAGAPGPGDGVGALGFLVQCAADLSAAQRHTEHVGDEAVAEQRDGFAQLLIGVVHGRGPRRWGASARERGRYAGADGGSGPILCWRARLRFVVLRRWGWNPNGAGSAWSCAAV